MALLKDAAKLPRVRPGRRESIHQAVQLQNIAFNLAKGLLDSAVDPKLGLAFASLCKAWDTVQERKRIIRGLPLPGSLKPVPKTRKRKVEQLQPVESLPEPQGISFPARPVPTTPSPAAK